MNVAVVGNCYDTGGNKIDIKYKVGYLNSDAYTPVETTVDSQLIINTNDDDHLGFVGGVRVGEPIYIIGWEVDDDETTVLRNCRKRISYSGEAVINKDIMLYKDLVLTTNISYEVIADSYIFKPDIDTVEPVVEVIYNVYYNANNIETDSSEIEYMLIKTIIKENDSDLSIKFTKSGEFKITCEAVISNNEVSETSELIVDINLESTSVVTEPGTTLRQQHYIEWE